MNTRLFDGALCICRGTLFLLLLFVHVVAYASDDRLLPPVMLDATTIRIMESGDWDGALAELVPLYAEEGIDSNLQYYIAHCYRRLAAESIENDELREGLSFLIQALDYVDTDSSIYGDLGSIYLQLSSYDEARDAFLSAVELDDQRVYYFEALARIAYLVGQGEESAYYYQRALELEPGNENFISRLQKLVEQEKIVHSGTTEMSHLFSITFDEGMDREIYNTVWEMLRDSWYDIGIELDLWPKRQIPVLLMSREKYNAVTGAPAWSGGVYEGQIKIPVAQFDEEMLRDVIYHEYLHALIHDAMASRCPWWLNEGLAQYFQIGAEYKKEQLGLAAAMKEKEKGKTIDPAGFSTLSMSAEDARFAYAYSFSAVNFLFERFTVISVRSILADMGEGASFEDALYENTGFSYEEFLALWNKGY